MSTIDRMLTSELDATQVETTPEDKLRLSTKIVTFIAISMSLFHIYTCIFGIFDFITQRGVHLAFAITIIVLQTPLVASIFKGRLAKNPVLVKAFLVVDVLLIGLMWVGVFIARWEYGNRINAAGQTAFIATIAGFIMLVIILEVSRRQLGLVLPLFAVISIIYAWAGPYLPFTIMHKGYSFEKIFTFLAANPDGIFGTTLAVSATVIFLFILFGSFLEASGANDFINSFAMALTGRTRSGPAMAAVLASALMGTINGSAVANVVGTGTFTIPLMKKAGFKPEFAGAVEATASTGGQILPPVMGAGAFIMVMFTSKSYSEIVVAATIPAVLYFLSIAAALYFKAGKWGLKGMPADQLPKLGPSLKKGLLYLPAVALLIYLLFVVAMSPMMSAFYATLVIPICMMFKKESRFDRKKFLRALESASKNALTVVLGCACAGIIVSMVAITGLGVVFSDTMISMAGDNLFLALVATAFACIVMGMGLPTTAAYVIAAAIAAPALIRLGIPILAAHLFVFYYACLSAITPPVALAAYAGAGIAKADPMRTAIEATKLGFAGFIVPFMFAYSDLLLFNGSILAVIYASLTALVGCVAMSAGFQGFLLRDCNFIERILLLAGGLAMVKPGFYTDIAGIIIIVLVVVRQYHYSKKETMQYGA